MTLTLNTTYTVITCCYAGCGITFAVPQWWKIKRGEDHKPWCCPNGHSQHFAGLSEAEKLRQQLADQERRVRWAKEDAERARRRAVSAETSRRVTKGHLTRIRKRVAHGVCPCCQRTVRQLARHMATKHPNYAQDATSRKER